MGFARAMGAVVMGIDGHLVDVEAHVGPGLPEFRLVGLPDAAVRESRDRVWAALRQAGVPPPAGRITVNLAPARLRKFGSTLDLAIACAVMAAAGLFGPSALRDRLLVGELSLDGRLRSVEGLVPLLVAARRAGVERVVLPGGTEHVAALVPGMQVWPARTLAEVLAALRQNLRPERPAGELAAVGAGGPGEQGDGVPDGRLAEDMADVRGQALARRAVEVAAAGGHHLMLVGPPGSGKTLLARRLVGVLPPLSREEWLEVAQVYSAAGQLPAGPADPGALAARGRPLRAPHHSCTVAGLIGGGARLRPGELTLAHRGVLFLDEFAEMAAEAVDALREPMEQGSVSLVRGSQAARLPADVLVVAASNPCPCGRLGAGPGAPRCRCRPGALERYRRRLEGPVADRFDLWVEMRPVPRKELLRLGPSEPSAAIRARVVQARERQLRRFGPGRPPEGGLSAASFGQAPVNGRMTPEQVRRFCQLAPEVEAELVRLGRGLGVSARGIHSILKVARTLADLDGEEGIGIDHVREAFQFRRSPPSRA